MHGLAVASLGHEFDRQMLAAPARARCRRAPPRPPIAPGCSDSGARTVRRDGDSSFSRCRPSLSTARRRTTGRGSSSSFANSSGFAFAQSIFSPRGSSTLCAPTFFTR